MSTCDSDLSGWYRFGGGAGTKMQTSCIGNTCGADTGGWMKGAHPTVAQGKVTRKVCYQFKRLIRSRFSYRIKRVCCENSNSIEVVNCGQYYVYRLIRPPRCDFRYCGSDN